MVSAKMTAAQASSQVVSPYGNMNWTSWEITRMTMIGHESAFRYQVEELHRLHKKQKELVEEFKAKAKGQSSEHLKSLVKKPTMDLEDENVKLNEPLKVKVQGNRDTNATVTPKPMNPLTPCEKLLDQDTSSLLLWFADIVTSIKPDTDLALLQKKARLDEQKKARVASRQGKKGKMLMPRHPASCPVPKKKRTLKQCTHDWGTIKKGRRSKRIPDEDPTFTFERGALLCRWR